MLKISNILGEIINESIHPSEANNNSKAIQSLIDGKRKVGFVVNLTNAEMDLFNSSDKLGSIRVESPHMSFVIYRNDVEGAKEDAQELAGIAKKYGGFLPTHAGEDTYRIGILLGYDEEEVRKFVEKKQKS